jgi:methionyl-tRNA synthetase
MTGFNSKRDAAADKLQEPWNQDEWRKNNWRCQHGWLRGEQCEICNAAQPAQEPVATLEDLEQEIYQNTRNFVSRDVMEWMLRRYYTHPPKREWVGLTPEETSGFTQHEMTVMKYVSKVLQEKNG